MLEQIAEMTITIKQYDRQIQQLGETEYPETQAPLKVFGVGHITALTYVLFVRRLLRIGRVITFGLLGFLRQQQQPRRPLIRRLQGFGRALPLNRFE